MAGSSAGGLRALGGLFQPLCSQIKKESVFPPSNAVFASTSMYQFGASEIFILAKKKKKLVENI